MERRTVLYLAGIFAIIIVTFSVLLLFLYLRQRKEASLTAPSGSNIDLQSEDVSSVSYKGIPIPLGFAEIKELGKTAYTGTVESLVFNQEAKITLSANAQVKAFSFDPKTTVVAINDPKDAGTITVDGKAVPAIGTIRWSIFLPVEVESYLKKGTIASLLFTKQGSSSFPTQAEIEANASDIQISILIHTK